MGVSTVVYVVVEGSVFDYIERRLFAFRVVNSFEGGMGFTFCLTGKFGNGCVF